MFEIKPLQNLKKEIFLPADKSITHRAFFISSITQGKTEIISPLFSEDTIATLQCLKKLGVKIKVKENSVTIHSVGPYFQVKDKVKLNAHQSGTTIRLISGLLVAQKFSSVIHAVGSLNKRPMLRITLPLRMMGANIKGRKIKGEEYPPLRIKPTQFLKGIRYAMPQASAQVKSAIMFASLYAQGMTRIKEPYPSRDHTERMLKVFGAKIKVQKKIIFCEKSTLKTPGEIFIPGDFSSASFFIALGILSKGSELLLKRVSLNPTRIGFLNILKRMGANIRILRKERYFEPYGDILVKSSRLKGIRIAKKEIPLMIDEIPILFVCAAFAKGKTCIYGLKELRVKETDRISSMVYNLKKIGVRIEAHRISKDDWMVEIEGGNKLKGTNFKSFSDHRTAMSLIILGLVSENICTLDDVKCIDKSFPEFIPLVSSLYNV